MEKVTRMSKCTSIGVAPSALIRIEIDSRAAYAKFYSIPVTYAARHWRQVEVFVCGEGYHVYKDGIEWI